MTRYDPHPQAHDDARSTPHGFTTGPSAAQNGSGVPEEGGGLREALEELADGFADTWAQRRADADREPPGTTQQHVDVAAGQAWWVAERNLRAVLAAHPADAPAQAPESSGDVVERTTQVLADVHGAEPHIKAHALADAGLLADPARLKVAENQWRVWRTIAGHRRRTVAEQERELEQARARVAELEAENWDLVKERDRAIVEQRPLVDSLVEARRQRDVVVAAARRAEDALWELRDNTKHSAMQRAIIDRALSDGGE